jgi:hypothetical protein
MSRASKGERVINPANTEALLAHPSPRRLAVLQLCPGPQEKSTTLASAGAYTPIKEGRG